MLFKEGKMSKQKKIYGRMLVFFTITFMFLVLKTGNVFAEEEQGKRVEVSQDFVDACYQQAEEAGPIRNDCDNYVFSLDSYDHASLPNAPFIYNSRSDSFEMDYVNNEPLQKITLPPMSAFILRRNINSAGYDARTFSLEQKNNEGVVTNEAVIYDYYRWNDGSPYRLTEPFLVNTDPVNSKEYYIFNGESLKVCCYKIDSVKRTDGLPTYYLTLPTLEEFFEKNGSSFMDQEIQVKDPDAKEKQIINTPEAQLIVDKGLVGYLSQVTVNNGDVNNVYFDSQFTFIYEDGKWKKYYNKKWYEYFYRSTNVFCEKTFFKNPNINREKVGFNRSSANNCTASVKSQLKKDKINWKR